MQKLEKGQIRLGGPWAIALESKPTKKKRRNPGKNQNKEHQIKGDLNKEHQTKGELERLSRFTDQYQPSTNTAKKSKLHKPLRNTFNQPKPEKQAWQQSHQETSCFNLKHNPQLFELILCYVQLTSVSLENAEVDDN